MSADRYAALLAGLERSCTVAHQASSCVHGGQEKACRPAHAALTPSVASSSALSFSFPPVTSTPDAGAASSSPSLASSLASYSPLATQRRSEAANVAASAATPAPLFELRLHKRHRTHRHRTSGVGVQQESLLTSLSDKPGAAAFTVLDALRAASEPKARAVRSAADVHRDEKSQTPTRASLRSPTSCDYLHYFLARYGAGEAVVRGGVTTARQDGDSLPSEETLSLTGPCAAYDAHVPGCSPILPARGLRADALPLHDDSACVCASSADVACRLLLSTTASSVDGA